MKHFVLIASLLLAVMASVPAYAQSAAELDKKLKQEKEQKEVLASQIEALEGQLDRTRGSLVDIAKEVQKNEQILQKLESRIADNEKQQEELQGSLAKDREQISHLILALERIRRVPPEALIARPGAPMKTAQSAMLMGDIIPTLHKHAETLRVNLETLDKITAELKEDRRVALDAAEELKAEQTKLGSLVDKREDLYSRTQADYKEREAAVAAISEEAQNLRDLMAKLEQEKERTAKQSAIKQASLATPVPKSGQPQLPISGMIKVSYGGLDEFSAESKGLTIEGRGGALVVAPMGGKVMFAGPFKRYGNMVIIEHRDGYHSLIAGLSKIDTVVGHDVSAGEPLGLLHHSSNGLKPTLYYELRHNGQPVNPSTKFAGLS